MANDFMRVCKKVGKKGYQEEYFSDNKEHVMEMFASYMTAKYLHKVDWIKSVKDEPNYAAGGRIVTFRTTQEHFDGTVDEFKVEFRLHKL